MPREFYAAVKEQSGSYTFRENTECSGHSGQCHRMPVNPLEGYVPVDVVGESVILKSPLGYTVACYGPVAEAMLEA